MQSSHEVVSVLLKENLGDLLPTLHDIFLFSLVATGQQEAVTSTSALLCVLQTAREHFRILVLIIIVRHHLGHVSTSSPGGRSVFVTEMILGLFASQK